MTTWVAVCHGWIVRAEPVIGSCSARFAGGRIGDIGLRWPRLEALDLVVAVPGIDPVIAVPGIDAVIAGEGADVVIAAGGVSPENAAELVRATGVRQLHASARRPRASPMLFRRRDVFMGGEKKNVGDGAEPTEYTLRVAEAGTVLSIVAAAKGAAAEGGDDGHN